MSTCAFQRAVARRSSVTVTASAKPCYMVTSRRSALAGLVAPLAGAILLSAGAAEAAKVENLSKSQIQALQRAERKEAMKNKVAKIKAGDKPTF